MNVIIDFNRRFYVLDYIKYLLYDFIGTFEKIIILLFLTLLSISFLNYIELINFHPKYINIARNAFLIFICGYFGVEIIKSSILSYKLNKSLKKIETHELKIRIDKNMLTLYDDDNDILKSIELKNLTAIKYLKPSLYLIDINQNVFFIINKRRVRTNNFLKFVEYFDKKQVS